ncbi:MAG TPA: hypothetical protein VGG62_13195 [Terracidiphilus sp.]
MHAKADEANAVPEALSPAPQLNLELASPAHSTTEEPVPQPLLKFVTWLPLLYIMTITFAEMVFIECYCHWHGAQFLLPNPLNLYSPDNIAKLSRIGFVGGSPASTMDFTAEIMMWASLGVWSQRISGEAVRYQQRVPNPPFDLTEYIGILGCHTSIAAALMIVLKLSGFKIFGISLDSFEATAGIAFILGYFGKQTEYLLTRIRDQVFGKKNLPREHENHSH